MVEVNTLLAFLHWVVGKDNSPPPGLSFLI